MSRLVRLSFTREETLACIIALEKGKSYKWGRDALTKLDKVLKPQQVGKK